MLAKGIRLYRNSFAGLSRDIWLLAAVTLLNRAGTMVIPFMTVFLTYQKDFTLQQAGWVMTSFGLGSVLGSYTGGWLSDRYNFSKVQFWTLLLSGIMFIVLQTVDGVWHMCIAVFVLSAIADAFRPANMAAVATYSTPETRTRSLSLNRQAVNLGFAIGPAVGGWLAATKGYNWLFWVDGLTCIAAAFLLRILLTPKARQAELEKPAAQNTAVLISAYRDWHYLAFMVITMFSAIAFMQLFYTYPVFLKSEYHFIEVYIG
ncbi:MAG: MFS transporter [Saprospiraceae bacterium]|nr:MFS transporter [Saprospiraceae bacterium]